MAEGAPTDVGVCRGQSAADAAGASVHPRSYYGDCSNTTTSATPFFTWALTSS
jgi:hypothetical protein